MPNWCENTITISGSAKEIKQISDVISNPSNNKVGLFMSLVGHAKDLTIEEYENGGWYDSNIMYWGTKWDIPICDCSIDYSEGEIVVYNSTAWSPPSLFCILLAKKYNVSIRLFFSESGCNFCGEILIDSEGKSYEDIYGYWEGLFTLERDEFYKQIGFELNNISDEDNFNAEDYVNGFSFISNPKDRKNTLQYIINTLKQKNDNKIK